MKKSGSAAEDFSARNSNLSWPFFFHLWEKKKYRIFWIGNKRLKHIWKNMVTVRKMVSGFAMKKSDEGFFANLEKIGVELWGEWKNIYPDRKPAFYLFLKRLNKDYLISHNTAHRRKWKQVFDLKKWPSTDEKSNYLSKGGFSFYPMGPIFRKHGDFGCDDVDMALIIKKLQTKKSR